MFTIFNSESLWIGTDMNKFSQIRNILDNKSIKYKYKVKGYRNDTPLLLDYWCLIKIYRSVLKSDSDVGKDIAWGIDEIQWSVSSEHAVGVALIIEDVVEINACCNISICVGK